MKLPKADVVVCMASGPSLTLDQVFMAHGAWSSAKTIAVNRTYEVAPIADIVYATDRRFWNNLDEDVYKKTSTHTKLYSIEGSSEKSYVTQLPYKVGRGLGKDHIVHCGNSGVMAINLAYLMSAKKIILIGYDFQHTNGRIHHHSDYDKKKFPVNGLISERWFKSIDAIAKDLANEGVDLVNCSTHTAITSCRRSSLEIELGIKNDIKHKTEDRI